MSPRTVGPLAHAGQPTALTRRRFLLGSGAAAGAVLLGACGGDDGVGSGGSTSTTTASSDLSLVQFFGGLPMLAAGAEMRTPFGVADTEGLLPVERTPERLTMSVLDPDGAVVVEPTELTRRADGLPRAYFPLKFSVDEPGIYTGRTELDGDALEMAIKVDAAGDVTVIQPGTALPAMATPTTADPRDVDPICTAEPMCPLHDVTVAEALAEGKPLALLVSTPAFCQIAICGPVLDVLLSTVGDHPEVRFLHAEVYAHPEQDLEVYAPVVDELGLTFEPSLILVGSDGKVVERLDTIYDATEASEALARLS
jgi:hypothetical protein